MGTLLKNPKDKNAGQHASSGTGINFSKKTSKKILDPAGLWKDKPKAPEKTAEELAGERRTRSLLDKEIGDEEEKLRALSRGRRGSASLLGKAASNRKDAATKKSSTPKRTGVGGSGGASSYGGKTGFTGAR